MIRVLSSVTSFTIISSVLFVNLPKLRCAAWPNIDHQTFYIAIQIYIIIIATNPGLLYSACWDL